MPGLARLAGLGCHIRVVTTIVYWLSHVHHHDLHAWFHWAGRSECVRQQAAGKGNRETKQEGDESTHLSSLSEENHTGQQLGVRFSRVFAPERQHL
ncbi:hypothetical protein [Zobellella aerophila]|uniref:hypothetical protein n=1 Tax=Zobellella aerophila TaxID=870480 RepID=UPI0031E78EA0